MSSISNRFYITALEDGTTLHGNLSADQSLSQAWTGIGCTPNWELNGGVGTLLQPTIHLTLLSGATTVGASSISEQKWYYNNEEIYFMNETASLTVPVQGGATTTLSGYWSKASSDATSADKRFFKYNMTIPGTSTIVPALRICSNVASSSNVDVDTIKFTGIYNTNGSSIDFAATIQVRITEIAANGYLGVINFVDGVSDITVSGQTLTLYGILYGSDGNPDASVTTSWKLNNEANGHAGTTISGYSNAFQVTEKDVVDHAIITCEFKRGNETVYTAYAAVDDMQDPEFMYIQYGTTTSNVGNGNSASLRKGENAYFAIWVGRRDDPSVIKENDAVYYNDIKVKLLDGNGNVITAVISGIPNAVDGWRTLQIESTDVNHNKDKALLTVSYDVVNQNGKNITGIIQASHVQQS